MDENHFEHADLLAEQERLRAIQAARKRLAPEPRPANWNGLCVDCEDDIPAERLALGRVRCTSCQTLLEKKLKR